MCVFCKFRAETLYNPTHCFVFQHDLFRSALSLCLLVFFCFPLEYQVTFFLTCMRALTKKGAAHLRAEGAPRSKRRVRSGVLPHRDLSRLALHLRHEGHQPILIESDFASPTQHSMIARRFLALCTRFRGCGTTTKKKKREKNIKKFLHKVAKGGSSYRSMYPKNNA